MPRKKLGSRKNLLVKSVHMVAYENKIVYLHLEQKVLVIQIVIATRIIEPIDDQR